MKRSIRRIFAVAKNIVSVVEFLQFRKDHSYNKPYSPKPTHPINTVTWYAAVAYCNWLSEKERLTAVYEANKAVEYAKG